MRASRFGADLDNRISVNPNKKAFVVAPLTGNDCDMFQGPKLIPIGGLDTKLISRLHTGHCSLVSNAPIGTGFGPQNITVITSQEFHHWHAFYDQNCRNHFPHALETET